MAAGVDAETMAAILIAQRDEITGHLIYRKLARAVKDAHNRDVLERIAADELRHYEFWKGITGREMKPKRFSMVCYFLISRIFGLTFGTKLMEMGERRAKVNYAKLSEAIPEAQRIAQDEEKHEAELSDQIEEERLKYAGSVVLGLNDALVELTGMLAGLTLALQDLRLIGIVGLITGISASLSMGASEYLATKSEDKEGKSPLKASVFTGSAYVLAVCLLILPFFLLNSVYSALGVTLLVAIAIIFFFTFYISVARGFPFRRRFLEMVSVSLGVAALSFGIGALVRHFLGVEV